MADNNTNELDALMISELPTQATANETDLFEVAIVDANSASGYASKKESAAAIADAIVGEYQYPLRITGTTAKTIAGAINELKNLVDLLPQFAIEVVSTLPVSDISTTTIYLVPASDPEQGNYYEEYIYVNNAWELVGTTAVDLTGYYTSAQVDTLLAAKANTSSLATVATSGAYSDLTGKPTIDTALDTTSTNAVENRAVAGEINSIKSDITVDGSASGDIATFVDGSDNPLKALKISIVAQQSGTGNPSPQNERPIIGFSAVDVTRTVKNILAKKLVYTTETNKTISDSFYIKAGTYTFSFNETTATSWRIGVVLIDNNGEYLSDSQYRPVTNMSYNAINKAWIDGADGISKLKVLNIIEDCYIRIIFLLGNTTADTTFTDVQLEQGSTATAYEPYNGETINIDWEDEAGTVYGGTLDVKTGVLTVTHANIASYDGETINEPWISSMDVYSAGATPTTGAQVVYPLATPVTYQLTPTEVRSLLGVNNVWADCGAITELKYTRDLNLCINDIIARIEALEGGSNTRSLSLSPTLTKSLTSELDKIEGKAEEETEEETKEEAQNER